MHVQGDYRTRWTFYWLSPQEFSGDFYKILTRYEKRKNKDSAESYRRVLNTFLPHFYMHITGSEIYTVFVHDKDHILKLRTLALFLKSNF